MECTSFDYLFLGVCSELCQLSVSVTSELLISAFVTCLSLHCAHLQSEEDSDWCFV